MLSASRLALLRSTARKTDKTTVKVEDNLTLSVKGIPVAYTADGVRRLIKSQEGDCTWKVTEENDRGESMSSTLKRDSDESLLIYDDKPADKPGKGGRKAKEGEGEPAPAGSNGHAG